MENQKFYSYQCPCCGATMTISPDQKKLTCEYCGKKLMVAQNKTTGQTELRKRTVQNKRNVALIVAIVIALTLVGSCVSCITLIGGVATASSYVADSSSQQTKAVKEVDPFEKLVDNQSVTGFAPYGKLNVDKISNSEIRGIKYTADKSTDLSNGDVVTLTAQPLEGYTWTTSTREIKIYDLDTIVTDDSQISEDDLAVLHEFCINKIDAELRGTIDSDEEISLLIEPYNIYCNVDKDHNFYGTNPFRIHSAYKVDFVIEGVSGTIYKYVTIPAAVIQPDGTLKASYDQGSSYDGFISLDELGVKRYSGYIDGYKTVLEMESSLQDDDSKLYK